MTVILTTCVHSVGGVAGGLPCGVCEQNKMLQTRYLREMQADGSSRVRDLYSPESGVTEPDQTDLEISMLKEQQDALGLKLMEVEVEKVELKALTKKATQDLATAEGLLRRWEALRVAGSRPPRPDENEVYSETINFLNAPSRLAETRKFTAEWCQRIADLEGDSSDKNPWAQCKCGRPKWPFTATCDYCHGKTA